MALELTFEEIGPLRLCISKEHRFGTDAFLLADFAQARRGDRACDLCSGCGIIPILWLRREERRPAVVYGVELLEQAAKQMDITCRENGLEKIFIPLCRDLRELDREDIPLEEAFAAYSAGMAVLKQCNDQIDKVEKQVLKLTQEGELEGFGDGCISI